jgi:hypothetical protein
MKTLLQFGDKYKSHIDPEYLENMDDRASGFMERIDKVSSHALAESAFGRNQEEIIDNLVNMGYSEDSVDTLFDILDKKPQDIAGGVRTWMASQLKQRSGVIMKSQDQVALVNALKSAGYGRQHESVSKQPLVEMELPQLKTVAASLKRGLQALKTPFAKFKDRRDEITDLDAQLISVEKSFQLIYEITDPVERKKTTEIGE